LIGDLAAVIPAALLCYLYPVGRITWKVIFPHFDPRTRLCRLMDGISQRFASWRAGSQPSYFPSRRL